MGRPGRVALPPAVLYCLKPAMHANLMDQPRPVLRRSRALASATLVGCVVLFLAACGTTTPEYVEQSVEDLYNQSMDSLLAGNYLTAAQNFDEVERQHPYSVWATRAQLMVSFAYYQGNQYDDAIFAAQRFIHLHPGFEDIDYAYYLIAISYYERIVDVGRDQGMTEFALQSLDEVVRRFPDSDYARDARLKIDLARDHLAGKEMAIGRYYLGQGQYLAAINRFRSVIETYQTTTHVPEALHRLAEAYLAIGVTSEAQTAAAVLGYNFPGSEWYLDSYALLAGVDLRPEVDEGSVIARIWNSIF